MNGSLFLIPTYLSKQNDASFIAPMVCEVIKNTSFFLVENIRTARRYISSLKLGLDISALRFEVMDKNTSAGEIARLMRPIIEGQDMGVISEAGLPGIADPGQLAITYAHQNDIRVIPLPGTSSITTALTSSGFNGQQFTFHGYLPIQKNERIKAIRHLESLTMKNGSTQIFMETPYRNNALMEDLLKNLNPSTWLHVSGDLFGESQLAITKAIKDWQRVKIDLHKLPAVFCVGQI